jgi:hypothetical protein
VEGLGDVAGAGDKKPGKPLEMGAKRLWKAGKGRNEAGRVKFTGSWSFTVNKQWLIVSQWRTMNLTK